jgi:hypothetical protein
MYTIAKHDQTCSKIMFMVGCILNEKMMPDVTITVPNSKLSKTYRKLRFQWTNVVEQETSRPCAHQPSNSLLLSKKLSGASPYLGISLETSHL